MDRHVGVTGVIGAAEHRLQLEIGEVVQSPADRLADVFVERVVAGLLGHFEEHFHVIGLAGEGLERLEDAVEGLQLGNDTLGGVLVVPERGAFHLLREIVATGLLVAEVKESLEG